MSEANPDQAAASLQRLSRAYLARRSFRERQKENQKHSEAHGIAAPFVPTPDAVIDVLNAYFLLEDDVLCDLGCGDGRVLLRCTKVRRSLGVDIQEGPLQKAKAEATRLSLEAKITWIQGDFRDPEVESFLASQATACFLFLLPKVLIDLLPYLVRTMRVGTRLICYAFCFPRPSENQDGPDVIEFNRSMEVTGLPNGANIIFEYVISEQMKRRFEGTGA